jgi:[ribosomal protein S5]-alanine N-acetyltransferase
MPHPRLNTERLLLRAFQETDLPDVIAYACREDFYRFMSIPIATPENTRVFLTERLADAAGGATNAYTFAIEPNDEHRVIGSIRITTESDEHRSASIGYGLHVDWWGRGFMTEAARAVVAFGFESMKLHRIWAMADVENVGSWQVMERIGMRREGLLVHEKCIRGEWRDTLLYAIVASP